MRAPDLAVAAAVVSATKAVFDERWSSLAEQQSISTERLATVFRACIQDAEGAAVQDSQYLRLLGLDSRPRRAREIWTSIALRAPDPGGLWNSRTAAALETILQLGPLARRIIASLGDRTRSDRLNAVYARLCDCLARGSMFTGLD